ncbi:HD-GYP domain-containing protein [Thalassobacillus sp. CUG 92003]|uniref:HD-GYP domain-containing protein n=1 Tax=Thalassobacillus sp. CUG 92003 TaxID=2736641 RepID=UPI0015E6D02D|nr:HD-GYP domain-containing protein [Thalassobacillus sp. CUG 92003]
MNMKKILKSAWIASGIGALTLVVLTLSLDTKLNGEFYLILSVLLFGFLPFTLLHKYFDANLQNYLFLLNGTLFAAALYYAAPFLGIKLFFFNPIFAMLFKKSRYFIFIFGTSLAAYLAVTLLQPELSFSLSLTIVHFSIFLAYILILQFVARVMTQYEKRNSLYTKTMRALVMAIEAKDVYTQGHSVRVSDYSVRLGKQLKQQGYKIDIETLRVASLLHDIGKLHLPTHVLQKEGPLTEDEYETIKLHPTYGSEIAQELGFQTEIVDAISFHHERIDGHGYPAQLPGEAIPLYAKIISVVDAFDAMTSTRSYRAAFSPVKAKNIILENKGTQFDPVLVEAFEQLFPSLYDEFKNKKVDKQKDISFG